MSQHSHFKTPGIIVEDVNIIDHIYNRKHPLDSVIYEIEGDSTLSITCLKTYSQNNSAKHNWISFTKSFHHQHCNYAISNIRYTNPIDNVTRIKTVFIMWAPDNSIVKAKLMTSMYCKDVQDQLSKGLGFPIYIQANDLSDISYASVIDKIQQSCYCF